MRRHITFLFLIILAIGFGGELRATPKYDDLSETLTGNYLMLRSPMALVKKVYGLGFVSSYDDDEIHHYTVGVDKVLELRCLKDIDRTLHEVILRKRYKTDVIACPNRPLIKYNFKGVDLGTSLNGVLKKWGLPLRRDYNALDGSYYGLPRTIKLNMLLYDPPPENTGRSIQFFICKGVVFAICVTDPD